MGMGPANQQSGMGGKGAGAPSQSGSQSSLNSSLQGLGTPNSGFQISGQQPQPQPQPTQSGMGGKGMGTQQPQSQQQSLMQMQNLMQGQPQQPMQSGMGGKGGQMPPQTGMGQQMAGGQYANQTPQDNSQQAYNNFMATVNYAPGTTPPTYEQWAAQRQQSGMGGKGGKGMQQGPNPQAFYDAVGGQPPQMQPGMGSKGGQMPPPQMQPGMGGKGMGPRGMGLNRFNQNAPYVNDRFDGDRFSRNLDRRSRMLNMPDRFRGMK